MKKIIYVPSGKFSDHLCKNCQGSGRSKCPRCEATGTFRDGSTCPYCKGDRYVKCPACDGTGKIED